MSFANPYNFVKVSNKVDRTKFEDIKYHSRITSEETYSGIFKCSLKTVTKLFIPSTLPQDITEERIGTDENNRPKVHKIFHSFYYLEENNTKIYAIPASSLKGLIRSTAEAISNSCIHMFDGNYENSHVTYSINKELQKEKCVFYDENGAGICICCSMFGMANAKESEKTKNFKGKICFSDARLITIPSFEETFPLKRLSIPRPHHMSFYADNNSIKGRKFYYHHKDHDIEELTGNMTPGNRSITPLKSKADFTFTISFVNLTVKEYELLLLTLELEPELGHKIGMGKPLGLGSCTIKVKEIKEFTKKRYQSLSEEDRCSIYNKNNKNLIDRKDYIKNHRENKIPSNLKCILTMDNNFSEVRYPSGNEFSMQLHSPCSEFP